MVMEGDGLRNRSGTWSMTEAVTEACLCMCIYLGVENGVLEEGDYSSRAGVRIRKIL